MDRIASCKPNVFLHANYLARRLLLVLNVTSTTFALYYFGAFARKCFKIPPVRQVCPFATCLESNECLGV